MSHKIHIAYGFHVNCYHSYRGDTNDALGFGSDIRIIRKIIETLDRLNAEGIPVKGTWDTENFFSLEQILPQYAPDIIEGMKRRVRENGDENIIMGYSNGALGAMDEAELSASVRLAVSNPEGSGLSDIFGTCQKIVRPQEVMFTPSQVKVYNKLGVRALCLYYSGVPFDAFRTVIPPLPEEEAFNPLTYVYEGESLTVIPTYSNADVCDAGCLRAWVKDLHEKQERGEINRDLFLFINMDADAIFWESLDLPVIGNRLANTDGINGLVREVADLDYVVFDTPGGYLDTHANVGTITFGQDTADGNFTGYASWAEKPYNRKIWTAIERSRAAGKVKEETGAFLDRVKLLSTTHFGLATPVLNIQREKTADALASKITAAAVLEKTEKLTVYNTSGTDLQCLQLKCSRKISGVHQIKLRCEGLKSYTLLPMDDDANSIFAMLRFSEVCPAYTVDVIIDEKAEKAPKRQIYSLRSGDTELAFSVLNRVNKLLYKGKEIGGADFLQSYLTYQGKRYDFRYKKLTMGEIAGGVCVRLSGEISLPGAVEEGSFVFDFFTSDAAEGIFVKTEVNYPYTPERDAISTENSTLGRYTDMQWNQAVPFGLTPSLEGEISVIKRNFMGECSSFCTSSFGESDPENRALASFNHQLTAGMVGLTDGKRGFLLGNARTVLSSMAYCPMRLETDGTVRMNPFGTFFGPQRHHHNRSGDRILSTYTLIAPQGKSLAPSYNGSAERAVLSLVPFEGGMPEENRFSDLIAFADGAVAAENEEGILSPFTGDNVSIRKPCGTAGVKMRSPLMTGIRGNFGKYITRGVRAISYIARAQRKAK